MEIASGGAERTGRGWPAPGDAGEGRAVKALWHERHHDTARGAHVTGCVVFAARAGYVSSDRPVCGGQVPSSFGGS